MKKYIILISILFFCVQTLFAQSHRIHAFETKTINGKAINRVQLLEKYNWDVVVYSTDKKIKRFQHCKPDTLEIKDFEKVVLSTTLITDTGMLNVVYGLKYNVTGSVMFNINGKNILSTGKFSTIAKLNKQRLNNYCSFTLTDTLNQLVITYLPHEKINSFILSIVVGDNEWANQSLEERNTSDNESYALGFFYLTFAIIFLMFYLFSHKHNENLYFSLFCLFGSLSFLSGTSGFDFGIENVLVYAMIICIEFMALFLAKVLINKNRSKIPLFIIIIIAIASNHPYFMYSLGTLQINNSSAFTGITFAVLILYTSISALYYLVQGFGQKKWEAKTITVGCFAGFLINIMFPVVLALVYGNSLQAVFDQYVILAYVPDIGLCLYPLTVAFVLAKRNGRNQKQLIEQVDSIKKLSDLNLERETEKKKILEEQNSFLESKVAERTSELALKNELISYKNKEITDSLIYAKRIQSAILPDTKLIYKAFENSFIYYLPKDIVSGDFYGFSQKNNKIIIAAADCTGHGVSGAFMSMIGSSLLNQIISEKNITTPSLILDELNEGIIKSLKQRDSESHDGMDIALCSFDLKAGIVEFSGANRPMWIIRNNSIITYQANKFPIGGLQILHDDKFTNHEIKLEANDTIYIFSDGYADQFGGEFGKKFMTKHFKKVLLSIQHLTMPDQEKYLNNLFQEWKGNNEQVDDVLVIGIRIN